MRPCQDRLYPSLADPRLPHDIERPVPESRAPARAQEAPGGVELSGLSWAQLHIGVGLDGPAKVDRLLMLHRMAAQAEMSGRCLRADFFWQEIYLQLDRLWHDDDAWALAARSVKRPGNQKVLGGRELRDRVVAEVLMETHCAFYNGRVRHVEEPLADDRAFVHSGFIAKLIDKAGMSGGVTDSLLTVPASARINALRRAGRWDEAIKACLDLLQRLPNQRVFQDELVDLHVEGAIASLGGGESQAECAADAHRLRKAIDRLEAARCKFPCNSSFYGALSQCQQILAVKLANGGELADALAAARLAQKYDPYREEAVRTEEQLTELMTQLQAEIAEVQSQLARQPGAALNAEGQRLLNQAERGFGPMNEVEASAFAKALIEDFQRAQARAIWLEVGLPEPADRWDERAIGLRNALAAVLADPPAHPEGLPDAWSKAKTGDSDLAELDASLVQVFLRHRLFDNGKSEQPAAHSPDVVPGPAAVPAIAIADKRPSIEPLDYWLFSRQDLRVKLQAVAAVVVLVVAGIWYVTDTRSRDVREQAYQSIAQAVAAGADEDVIRAAETFLSAKVAAHDKREDEVLRHYDAAFARWFVANSYALDEEGQRRIGRYRQLVRE